MSSWALTLLRFGLVAAGICIASAILMMSPAYATGHNEAGDVHHRNERSPTQGQLLTRRDQALVEVPLAHTKVRIHVAGHLAEATVTQVFQNPYDEPIEAIYLFPLPTDAAVNQLEMKIGTRTITGTIHRRPQAKRIYERARRKGQAAALLTQERPNLFTQSVANIAPGAQIEVTMRYTNTLAYERGGYELAFPMVAGPRYLPGGARDETIQPAVLPPEQRPAHDIDLSVYVDAGVPIQALHSPSHAIESAGVGAHATVRIAASDTIPNKDFVLRYEVAGAEPAFALMAHRERADAPGSFVLLAQPPATTEGVGAREIVFVLDTSSSMTGEPLAKAKELIRRVLLGLRPDDTFQIVRFADRASALGPGPIANKASNIKHTLDWLDKLKAHGGTELARGIHTALAVPHDPARLRIVVFLSDGYIGNESEILAQVSTHMGAARLFGFGIGSAVNRYLLEEMAALGRGDVQFVRPDEDTASAVERFYQRIDAPMLTDIRIDWNGLTVSDLVPERIPDLFSGQPLVVAGHYQHAGQATITVHGRQAGRPVHFNVDVTLPANEPHRAGIAAVWARRRIRELERQRLRKDDPALVEEITTLALRHRLMSRYTAFVAVDSTVPIAPNAGAPKQVRVPVEVPQSVRRIAMDQGVLGYGYGTIGGSGGSAFAAVGHGGGGSNWSMSTAGSVEYLGRGSGGHVGASYGRGSGLGRTLHRSRSVPQVRIGTAVVTGSLDRNIIRRYVRRELAKIRYCYEKSLMTERDLQGVVTAEFTITHTGQVIELTADGIGDDALHTCVATALATITFPKVPGSGLVRVRYPFTLKRQEPTKREQRGSGD